MSVANLTISVAGVRFSGWTSVRVTRGIERAAGDFAVSVISTPDAVGPAGVPSLGSACIISLDDTEVLTGAVDSIETSYDADRVSVVIAGRSKTADLIDCSALTPPAQYRQKTIAQIAGALAAPYGVSVTVAGDVGAALPSFVVETGETVFEAIERLARIRGLLVTDTSAGALLLTRAGTMRADTELRFGVNVLSGSAKFDASAVYSEVRCKGQRAGSDDESGTAVTESVASALDGASPRTRILVLVPEAGADIARCRDRARWEAAARVGRSCEATYTVRGWRQSESGELWVPNQLVAVRDDRIGIIGELLIAEVEYTADENGERATLKLQPVAAFEVMAPADRPRKAREGVSAWAELEAGA